MSEDTDGAVGRCVSGCTIALVTSLYITASVVYHWMIQPPVYLALLFNFTWLMAMWSYIQTAFTDPGTPKCPEWQDWSRVREGLAKSVDQAGVSKTTETLETGHVVTRTLPASGRVFPAKNERIEAANPNCGLYCHKQYQPPKFWVCWNHSLALLQNMAKSWSLVPKNLVSRGLEPGWKEDGLGPWQTQLVRHLPTRAARASGPELAVAAWGFLGGTEKTLGIFHQLKNCGHPSTEALAQNFGVEI